MSPYYFILENLKEIMNSKFIKYPQDACSFIDLYTGPGVYFYSITDNLYDSFENINFYPYYNEILMQKK